MADEPTVQQNGQCSCTYFLILGMAVFGGVEGFRFASRWGLWAAVGGAVLGVLLAVPLTGIVLLPVLGIAWVIDRIRGVKDEA